MRGATAAGIRALDTLAVMERRGTISPGMRQAGEEFRRLFYTAQLDPLQAQDMTRPRVDGNTGLRAGQTSTPIDDARQKVWQAILAVGGLASPAGSLLWHVVGWERTVKEWARQQGWSGRSVSQEAASGMLVAALGTLEPHFGLLSIDSHEVDVPAFYLGLGRNIAAARTRAGKTQTDLARDLDISYGTLSQYERGLRHIGVDQLQRFADALGVTGSSLLPRSASK